MAGLQEIQWSELTVGHIGQKVHVQYENQQRYDIGTIVGIGSDSSSIELYLQHGAHPGAMHKPARGITPPRLYLLQE